MERTHRWAERSLEAHGREDQALFGRGSYLVNAIGGCNDCHTPGYGMKNGQVPEALWLTGTVQQVLRNVLANAIRFSPEGSRIDLGARWTQRRGGGQSLVWRLGVDNLTDRSEAVARQVLARRAPGGIRIHRPRW